MHPERIDGEAFAALYTDHLTHVQRGAEALLRAQGLAGMVIPSGAPKKKVELDDQYFPFRPSPHFVHWAPHLLPHAALVVVPGERPRLLVERVTSFWERPAPLEWTGYLSSFDVTEVDEGVDLGNNRPRRGRMAYVGDDHAEASRWGFGAADINPASVVIGDLLDNPEGLVAGLHALRTRKTPYVVACLAEATARAARGHKAARAAFLESDVSELSLHLTYLEAVGADDPDTPYKGIVALGSNGAVLHHVAYGRAPSGRAEESLLVDAGASCLGYGSDITRTWVRGEGGVVALFRALVGEVEAAQRRILAQIRVGLPYEDLHDASHHELAQALSAVGLLRGSADEAVAAGVTRAFFPHGLGHSLGLQVHDVGCRPRAPKPENPYLRHTSLIEEGQVFTIEPGLYFIDALLGKVRAGAAAGLVAWDVVDALSTFGGIRIEDNVVVQAGATPVRNLTRPHLPFGL